MLKSLLCDLLLLRNHSHMTQFRDVGPMLTSQQQQEVQWWKELGCLLGRVPHTGGGCR